MTMDFYDAQFYRDEEEELHKFRDEVETTPPPPERPTIEAFILARLKDAEMEAYRFSDLPLCNQMIQLADYGRTVVRWHQNWPTLVEGPLEFSPPMGHESMADVINYRISQQLEWMTQEQYRKRFGNEPPTAPLLRSLANLWFDHIDFNPEWRV